MLASLRRDYKGQGRASDGASQQKEAKGGGVSERGSGRMAGGHLWSSDSSAQSRRPAAELHAEKKKEEKRKGCEINPVKVRGGERREGDVSLNGGQKGKGSVEGVWGWRKRGWGQAEEEEDVPAAVPLASPRSALFFHTYLMI